jgi:hypothetical protein
MRAGEKVIPFAGLDVELEIGLLIVSRPSPSIPHPEMLLVTSQLSGDPNRSRREHRVRQCERKAHRSEEGGTDRRWVTVPLPVKSLYSGDGTGVR